MIDSCRKLFLTFLSSALALGSAQAAVRTIAVRPATTQKSQARPSKTPLDTIFLPHLQQRLAGAGAQKTSTHAVQPAAASSSIPVPNFAGFVNAPHYPARQESSCINDPYNCGVQAGLGADVDGDGKPDMVIVQNDGLLDVLIGDGKGGFAAPVAYSNPNYATTSIYDAFIADANKDGWPDVVAIDAGTGSILVYPNLKNGAFGTPIASSLAIPGNLASVAIGDVTGDGVTDVVALSFNSAPNGSSVIVQTYVGNGDSTFQAASDGLTQTVPIAPQIDLNFHSLALGDFNHDQKLDIAVQIPEYTADNPIVVTTTALGNGDGTFGQLNLNNAIIEPFVPSPFRNPFSTLSNGGLMIADVNNDGLPDLLDETDSNLFVALGDGSGGFGAPVETAGFSTANEYVVTDLNGDGIADLVQSSGTLSVWMGNGDGTFAHPVNGRSYMTDGGSMRGTVIADFDGDKKLDVANLGADYKQVSFFKGDGAGALYGALAMASPLDPQNGPLALAVNVVADVQGMGNSSIIFSDVYTGDIVTAIGDGKGNFSYVIGLPQASVPNLAYVEPVSADLNGDGKQDILLAGIDGSLSVAFSNGDGTFQNPKSLGITNSCELAYAAIGDVNGDGIADIVAPYPGDAICSGTVTTGSGYYVLLGTGNGSFGTPSFTAYGQELYSAMLVDMNKDGNVDLVLDDTPFYVGGTFAVDLLPGNGDGTFGTGGTVNSGYMVSQVLAGDINGDGKPDLILLSQGDQNDTSSYDSAGVLVMQGAGDGTFGATTQLANGNFFLNGALADVNNDGIPDLNLVLYQPIAQPNTYYGLSTLLGLGGGYFSAPATQLISLGSQSPLVGNFYSDNAPDMVVETGYGPALFIGQGGTTTSLAASASSISFGDSETLTGVLAPAMSGRTTPTGTVTFYDGPTLLSTTSVDGGSAVLATSGLAAGAHTITAAYSGDANYNPATLGTVAVTVNTLAPAFTLTGSASTLSLTRGQNGVVTLSLAANAAFSGAVNLSCSGAPANASCAVNPGSVTLTAGGTATATVVIGTTSARSANERHGLPLAGTSAVVSFAGLFCFVFGKRFRKGLLLLAPVALLAFSLVALTGCGSSSTPTAKKGSYTVTVTATPAGGGAAAQTATITLSVD